MMYIQTKPRAISYDKHGNIKTLERYGKTTAGTTFGIVDSLTMTHTGNQLLTVDDKGVNVTMSESADNIISVNPTSTKKAQKLLKNK